MGSPIFPGLVAMLLGVAAGVVLFVPFVAVQYRREGRLTFRQLVLWAGFLVYALALWTYTLLPLPSDPDAIRCVGTQLQPLQFVRDILSYPTGSLGALVRNPAVEQFGLNVALFFPLGFFLRLVWRRGVLVSAATGFGISLAIEATQYTGVWGIYGCAYRLFDVDDLLANTLGAMLGGVLSLVLKPRLARRDASYRPPGPSPVTFWRRMLGMLCDAVAFWLIGSFAAVAVGVVWALADGDRSFVSGPTDLAFTVSALAATGLFTLIDRRTPGDAAIAIRWSGGARPAVLRSLLRYLGGLGGWQLLVAFETGFDALFVLVVVIALIATPGRGGLPGLISGARPVDSREAGADAEVTGRDPRRV